MKRKLPDMNKNNTELCQVVEVNGIKMIKTPDGETYTMEAYWEKVQQEGGEIYAVSPEEVEEFNKQ